MTADASARIVSHAALPVLVYAMSVPAVAMRWRSVLRGVTGRRLPLGPLVLASLASSFVNNVTAGPAGDVCRVITLVRLRFATASRATAAAVYERLSEIPVIALMLVTAFTVFGGALAKRDGRLLEVFHAPRFAVAAGLLTVALLVAARFGRRPILRAWRAWRAWGDRGERGGFEAVSITPGAMSASASWSVLVWTLDIFRLWLIGRMFDAHVGLAQAAALSTIGVVGGWAPTVGGLGVVEGGLIAGLLAFGVPSSTAIAITAVERGISYGLATVAGAGALAALGGHDLWTAIRGEVGRQ
jgi:uncharacterized membrane protein YbhN (UPF0104 family)